MTVSISGTTGVTTPAVILTGSASGSITLVAPSTGTSTTITFPSSSGTALLQAPSGALSLTNGSGGILILEPAAGAGTTTITFPATAGANGQYLQTDGAGNTTWAASTGGAAAGATGQVQYNNAGAFAAAAGFTFNGIGQITLGAASTTSGAIRLFSSAGANPVTLGSGNNASAWNMTLPTGPGSNGQVLVTDGAGVTSWGAPAAGSAAGGNFAIGTASGTTGTLSLYNAGSASGVNISSGINTAPWTLTLPVNGGTNGQVLTTNGTGVTSWQTPAAGSAAGGTFDVGTGSSTTGSLNLYNAGAPGAVSIKSGVNTAPWTLTLPVDNGTNGQVLTTDGNGITSWTSPSAATAAGGTFGIGTASSTTGTLNMYNAGSANGVAIQSGVNSSNWTLTLPTGPGTAGYFMTTDGAGVTSWTQGSITIGTSTINLGATATALNGLTSVTVTTDPTSALELATKQYVDANVDPLNRISPVKYAAITNVAPTGNATIDGSAVVTTDRVLLIGNAVPSENGIWEVNTGGAWARPTDADIWTEIVAATVFVTSGSTQANTSWIQLTPAPGTMNVTAQNWVQQGGLNSYTGGLGVNIAVGNIINNTGVVVLSGGTTGLTNTFTALTGTATLGGTLAITNGGTGATTAAAALTALLPAQGGVPNNGKVLTTDGTTATWQTASASSAAGGTFTVGTASATTGTLSLFSSASALGVNIRSGANTLAWNLVLPQNGGTSGQVLQTDGTGATVWSTLVNAGVAGELAWYNASGSSVDGNVNATISGGALTLGVLATTAGSLKLNGGTSGVVTVQTAAAAGTWSLTLPTTAGTSGQVLQTDGSGVTSWVSNDAGLTVGTTAIVSGTTGSLLINTANVLQQVVMGTGVATALAANTGAANGFVTLNGSGALPPVTSGSYGTGGTTTGQLTMFNAGSANGVTLQSGVNAAAWTLTLPTGPGTAGQVLSTDGAGVTSWVSSGLTIGTTAISGGTNGKILFNSSNTVGEKSVSGTGDVVLKSGPEITSLRETKTNGTISSGVLAIDCALGNVLAISLNANITSITFSNVPASGSAYSIILSFTADGTARTIAWPAAVRWPGGTAPTMTSTNNKVDTIVLYTYDGGTNWFGFVSGQNA